MDAGPHRDVMGTVTAGSTAGILLIAGGTIYGFLGLAHAWYTWLDLSSPRRIVPDDPALVEAMKRVGVRLAGRETTMWRAWIGFNFSHSLGAVLFASGCIALGLSTNTRVVPSGLLALPIVVSALYALLAVRYWFRVPLIGTLTATGCFLAAWVVS